MGVGLGVKQPGENGPAFLKPKRERLPSDDVKSSVDAAKVESHALILTVSSCIQPKKGGGPIKSYSV